MKFLNPWFARLLMEGEPGDGGTGTGAGGTSPADPPAPPPPAPPASGTPPADPPVIGRGGNEMSPEAVSERVARERRKLWRDEYGTDDEQEVQKIRAQRKKDAEARDAERVELARLKRQDEQRKRSRMTEEQRLKADNDAKDARIRQLEGQIETMHNGTRVTKQDEIIRETFGKHIPAKQIRWAVAEFREHARTLSKEELAKFDAKKLGKWAEKFAEENELKIEPPAPPAGGTSPEPPKPRVVNAGAPRVAPKPAPKPAERGVGNGGKTVAPGQNAMSKRELNELYRQRGGSIPY